MSYLILWAVALVSLSSVLAVKAQESENAASHEDFKLLMLECTKEYGVGEAEMFDAVVAGDASIVNPCFWGCYFKKAGLLNNKGEYDLNTFLSNFKRFGWGEERHIDAEAAKRCESVIEEAPSDGENECERAALLAACFIKDTP